MIYYEDDHAKLILGDCLEILKTLRGLDVDLVVADPPYRLSNGGTTCRAGERTTVDKGDWDRSAGFEEDYAATVQWLESCRACMSAEATLWVSGTQHSIYSVGHALAQLRFKILNDVVWFKPAAPPNLACRTLTHAHETLVWAAVSDRSRYVFNYSLMRQEAGGKQLRSLWPIVSEHDLPDDVWAIGRPTSLEQQHGKHPTQKPEALLRRIILASSNSGQLVLDPFAGSGSTGVAAVRLGRKFVGIDRDERYLEIAAKRLESLKLSGAKSNSG